MISPMISIEEQQTVVPIISEQAGLTAEVLPTRERSLAFVNAICQELDQSPLPANSYPLKKSKVEELCRSLGYVVGVTTIGALTRSGTIPSPPRNNSGHGAWWPENVANLIASLESRQRWQPFHPIHDKKTSGWHLHRELWKCGLDPFKHRDVADWPLDTLIHAIASPQATPAERETAHQACLLKLRDLGIEMSSGS